MKSIWQEAGGNYQFPFMGAASRTLRGERDIACPKCQRGLLRCYWHMFNAKQMTGTIWVWCHCCRTVCHLPRVQPHPNVVFYDPFATWSVEAFEQVELDEQETFFDKLDRLWEEGQIAYPVS